MGACAVGAAMQRDALWRCTDGLDWHVERTCDEEDVTVDREIWELLAGVYREGIDLCINFIRNLQLNRDFWIVFMPISLLDIYFSILTIYLTVWS
jgi:hypothetical protein